MKHIVTLAFAAIIAASATQAQTTDLVLFAEDGSKFTLVVDGDVKNPEPASRVVATGLRNESPVVMVRFADNSVPQMRKSLYLPLGMEYTVMITTNKKGELVFRPTGEAALGTAAPTVAEKPAPATFVEDTTVPVAPITPAVTVTPGATDITQKVEVGGVGQVTTVTVVEEELVGDGTSEDVNITMGMPGVGFDVKVRVDEKGMDMSTGTTTGTTGTTTTRTTTTRTTTTTTTTG
ncbi:MAG: hypothetical protein WEC15_03885, partial [Flavobacteriales bacterium]